MTEYHNKSCTSWAYFLITGTAGHRSITITCSTSSDMERHIHNHIGDTYKLTLEQNVIPEDTYNVLPTRWKKKNKIVTGTHKDNTLSDI